MEISTENQKSARWWDLLSALLLIAALITASTRLAATRWTEHLTIVENITFLGVVLGLALGQSRFSTWLSRFFAFAYGLFLIPWQLGLTLGDGIEWSERLLRIGNRLLITIDQLVRQKPVTDNLFFLLLMSCLFWTLSVYAGYNLTRYGHPWGAIIPMGLVLIIIHAYDSFFLIRTWFLAAYLFFALLLVARLHFLTQYNHWKQTGSYLPPYISLDFSRMALLATAIIVLLAWTAPALASALPPAEQAWHKVISPWNTVRERMSNAFSALKSSVGFVTDFYGDTLPLGRGNPLTDTVVMTVKSPARVAAGVRYYWRARVYDYYDGSWTSTLPTTEALTPNGFNLNLPEYEGRTNATFTFTTNYPIQILFTADQPIWVNRPVQALVAHNSDGTDDLGYLKATPYMGSKGVYIVEASLSSATIGQLRQAGTDYPVWVTERYLQLPDNITPRTRELAAQIAQGLDNPYDISQAVTSFLRDYLTYSETVPNIPAGQEPIDWILFDQRQAFCNYYATAEIILLRSLGIPARLAVGYAEGERTSLEEPLLIPTQVPGEQNIPQEIARQSDLYTIRQRDAHAWPEVFFPSLGWVEFEPTASQLPIFRPEGDLASTTDSNSADSSTDNQDQNNLSERLNDFLGRNQGPLDGSLSGSGIRLPIAVWILMVVLGVTAIFLLSRRIRQRRGSPPVAIQIEASFRRFGLNPPAFLRRWVYYASLSPLSRAYLELNRALSRLGNPPQITDTPSERGVALNQLLPTATGSIDYLLTEYQNEIYGFQPGDGLTARKAGIDIRNSSFVARFQQLIARFQEPLNERRKSFTR
jgi:transglutaminase-like putative cysteine protease